MISHLLPWYQSKKLQSKSFRSSTDQIDLIASAGVQGVLNFSHPLLSPEKKFQKYEIHPGHPGHRSKEVRYGTANFLIFAGHWTSGIEEGNL